MSKYYYLEVPRGTDFDLEISTLAHSKYDCLGIEEFSIDEPRVDQILGERSYSGADLPLDVINEVDATVNLGNDLIKFFFASPTHANKFQELLLHKYQLDSQVVEKDQQDWNAEWKKSYAPINIDDQLSIIPEWDRTSANENDKDKVFIYPGMGFGTGNHETTFLCLQSVQKYKNKISMDSRCLDFGCGSGILGIVLNRLYGCAADLYDIDQDALNNCTQNIELNGLDKKDFQLLLPADRDKIDQKYNIVFANILQNVLLSEKKFLSHSVLPGGVLILSGLLKGQEDEVIEAYRDENTLLEHVLTYSKGDWVAVEMVLKG